VIPRAIAVSVRTRRPAANAWAQQPLEHPAECSLLAGERARGPRLTDDLGLAEHRRVQSGDDPEQVLGRIAVAAIVAQLD
jgi:hypothetical protein